MSVFARQNLFYFDKFAYGSAASTLLFLVIALITIAFIRFGHLNSEGGR
jgi:trehalose/maltose transport system permease protein